MSNRWMALFAWSLLILFADGCSREKKGGPAESVSTPESAAPASSALPAASMPVFNAVTPAAPALPSNVVVKADGKELTRDQLDAEVGLMLKANAERIPANDQDAARKFFNQDVIRRFITNTILSNEADRQKISVTPEDEAAMMEDLKAQMPEGTTVEQMLAQSPLGEAKTREAIRTGIRIKKLIESKIGASPEITDAEIDAFMAENKARLVMPESVRASHILVKFDEKDDDAAKTAKRQKIDKVREDLVQGGSFDELAAKNSDCPSKQRGGDLGTFRRGQMVPPFEEAAFSQEVGKIGNVVETKFGYHVIKVVEHNQPGDMPRDKVIEQMKQSRRQERRQQEMEFVRGLMDKASVQYSPEFQPSTEGPSAPPVRR